MHYEEADIFDVSTNEGGYTTNSLGQALLCANDHLHSFFYSGGSTRSEDSRMAMYAMGP